MIVFFLLALLIAGIRKLDIRPLWKDASLYPFYAVECVYWFFQLCTLCGNYYFISYSSYLQMAYLLSMLVPVLHHRLYGRAIAGSAMVLSGTALNRIVMAANGGHMPVFPTLSRLTGYFRPDSLAASMDPVHTLMTGTTALNFLGDYIDIGFSIMSPGDLLIHGFITLIVYGVLRDINTKLKQKSQAGDTL